MTSKESASKTLLNFGKGVILEGNLSREVLKTAAGIGKNLAIGAGLALAAKIKHILDPNVRLARTIKQKHDAFLQAGFSEEEAHEHTRIVVQKTVDAALSGKNREEDGVASTEAQSTRKPPSRKPKRKERKA